MYENFLHTILHTAETVSMAYWRRSHLGVKVKSDNSFVTKVDMDVEKNIRNILQESYPEHGIFGEEFGVKEAESDYMWVIDPIDGTRAFIEGADTFANMICLLKGGTPIISGIGFPAKGERYIAINGKAYVHISGCANNNRKTTVKSITASSAPLSACKIAYTSASMFTAEEFTRVQNLTKQSRGYVEGGDAYNYCRMAKGDNIIVVESDLKPYDFLPLVPIVKGAGGAITSWNGEALTCKSPDRVVAGGSAFIETRRFLS